MNEKYEVKGLRLATCPAHRCIGSIHLRTNERTHEDCIAV